MCIRDRPKGTLSIVPMVWWLKIAMYLSRPGRRTTAPEGEIHWLLAARWRSEQSPTASVVGSIRLNHDAHSVTSSTTKATSHLLASPASEHHCGGGPGRAGNQNWGCRNHPFASSVR